MKRFFPLFVCSLFLLACKTYSDDDLDQFSKQMNAFAAKSGIKYEQSESGLYYFHEKEGEGRLIKPTDEVSFSYVGRLLNGKVFDNRYKNKTLTFKVSSLIIGWQEAMLYMKKGGKMKLIVPPNLGYGENELEAIPKNSILLFDLEVKEVR